MLTGTCVKLAPFGPREGSGTTVTIRCEPFASGVSAEQCGQDHVSPIRLGSFAVVTRDTGVYHLPFARWPFVHIILFGRQFSP